MLVKRSFLALLFAALLLSACGGKEAAPTPDLDALRTSVAQTVIAEITASAPTATPAFTPTSAATSTPAATQTPLVSPTPTEDTRPCTDAAFLEDVTIPDYYDQLKPGELFVKTWKIKNVGSCVWTPDYKLVFGYGAAMQGKSEPIGVEVAPNESIEVSVTLTAPTESGTYTAAWRMSDALGNPFGDFLIVVIVMP